MQKAIDENKLEKEELGETATPIENLKKYLEMEKEDFNIKLHDIKKRESWSNL